MVRLEWLPGVADESKSDEKTKLTWSLNSLFWVISPCFSTTSWDSWAFFFLLHFKALSLFCCNRLSLLTFKSLVSGWFSKFSSLAMLSSLSVWELVAEGTPVAITILVSSIDFPLWEKVRKWSRSECQLRGAWADAYFIASKSWSWFFKT